MPPSTQVMKEWVCVCPPVWAAHGVPNDGWCAGVCPPVWAANGVPNDGRCACAFTPVRASTTELGDSPSQCGHAGRSLACPSRGSVRVPNPLCTPPLGPACTHSLGETMGGWERTTL